MPENRVAPPSLPPQGYAFLTENLFATLVTSIIGFCAAFAPAIWLMLNLDVGESHFEGLTDSSFEFLWIKSSLLGAFFLAKEVLIGAIALGVTATISWSESKNGRSLPLGTWANIFAGFTLIGTVAAIILLVWVMNLKDPSKLDPYTLPTHVSICYYFSAGTVVLYFLTLIQVRRALDSGAGQ